MKFVVAITGFAFLLLQECTSQTCPDDWIHFQESCYLFVKSSTNWHSSKSICETLRSHLVEVESAEENNFVTNIVKQHSVGSIWTGLQDFAEDAHFVWSTSLEPPTYTKWQATQPDDAGGIEDCVEIYSSGLWNDRPCDDYHSYPICEKDVVRTSVVG